MSPAPCHKDTCSVHWSTVEAPGQGRSYVADVNLLGSGTGNVAANSIDCAGDPLNPDPNAYGLGVRISPAANNLLGMDSGGLLVAGLPDPVIQTWDLTLNRSVPAATDNENPLLSWGPGNVNAPYYWVNNTGRDALVILTGFFNYQFAVLGTDSTYLYTAGTGRRSSTMSASGAAVPGTVPSTEANLITPYNANVRYRLLLNQAPGVNPPVTSGNAVLSENFDCGGTMFVTNTTYEKKQDRRQLAYTVIVPAGNHLGFRGEMFYEGPGQTLNVIAGNDDVTVYQADGFSLWGMRLTALPLT